MIDTILVSGAPGETRVALLAGGQTIEVIHHRAGHESLVGGVYCGRVTALAPGLNAAFIDIGEGLPGFLNAADARADPDAGVKPIGAYVREGEAVVVQVRRDAMGDKGPRLTMRPTLTGQYLVYRPGQARIDVSKRITDEAERERLRRLVGDDQGVTLRTRAARASDDDILSELRAVRTCWEATSTSSAPARLIAPLDPVERALSDNPGVARVVVDTPALYAAARQHCGDGILETWSAAEPLFEAFGVEAALDAALDSRVVLPSGGAVIVEQTEALWAIDVDSAGHHGGGKTVALDVNLEAAAEIGRQLRLRGIGGVVVIDFITMTGDKRRRRVIDALRAALAGDRDAVAPSGFTDLGLVEMRRRRSRPSLGQIMGAGPYGSAHSVALAIVRHAAQQSRAASPGSITIAAAAEVAQLLDGTLRAILAETTGRAVTVTPEPAYGRAERHVSFG
jgi:ribonuclease G